jgi:PAS domain S-box-containing protein
LKYGASFWSPQVEGILGFAQDAFVENPFLWAESIHPDDKNVVSQALIGDAPADWIVEYRIYRADGKLIWLSDQFLAKRTELDNIYVEGYATDITMRKVAEQNLFEKERKYKTLYNSSPVMLMSLSDEMRIVSANAFWLSKMKYNYQEVIGRSFSEFVLPQCRTQLTMYWNSLWNEVEVENTELQLQDSSGEIIEVKAFASKEKVSGNSSYNVVAYLLDVTQQKIATKALKNSEIKYHALMSVMREGLVLISQDGEILFANSAANLLLGLRTGDLWEEQNSDPTRKIIHPDGHIFDLKDYPAFLTLETGEAYQNIVMGIENIGKAIAWIRLNTEPIYHENNTLPSEVLVSFSDITELVEQEQRLRQLNQTKDKFFSIVAHDLRSPFNSIFGMVQLIKTRVEVNDYESISKYLNYLEESSNKFFNLLNNLLDWSRIQLNRFEFRSSIFSFEELVIDTIEQFAVNISNKNLEVVYAGEPKLKIAADKNMIASVLRNLLSNAIKFSHKGKKIHIYFGLNNSEVEFSVRDEGVGMDAQTLGQLFDDSRSASTLGTNSEHGTGLGLQLCKDFISKHNGRIRVESTLGLGSVFYCNFPNSK